MRAQQAAPLQIRFTTNSNQKTNLEKVKEALPANAAGMNQTACVGGEAFHQVARLPCVRARFAWGFRGVHGKVNHYRNADERVARRESPEAAVIGVATIIAHHKIICGRNNPLATGFDGAVGFFQIWFDELRAVDEDVAIVNFNGVTGQTDYTLDEIGRAFELRSANNYNLLALGISPQRNVPRREGQAHVVAGAAHDEVIADE